MTQMPVVPGVHSVRWLQRSIVGTVGALLVGLPMPAVAGSPAPTPTPSQCIGDCDNLGQVTVDELLTMVNIALGLDATATCAAGDANGDGTITVDEILKAVNLALTRCPLVGSDADEAAAGVDESTDDAIDSVGMVVGLGKLGPGGGGAAGGFPICPAGGTVDIASCKSNGQISTLTATFSSCRDVDPQTQASTVRSGSLRQTVADPEYCATGQIPLAAPLTLEFRNFTVTTLDAGGQTIAQAEVLTDVFIRSGQGCHGPNGTESVEGVLTVQRVRAGSSTSAMYTYRKLAIETASVTGPAACIAGKRLNGGLAVDDRTTGRRFSETLRDFVVASQQLDSMGVRSDDGTLVVDCLGEVRFRTLEPLRTGSQTPCPLAGVLEVRLPDGTVSQARFSPNGVAFDFNGDGEIDKRVTSCLDAALAQCTDGP